MTVEPLLADSRAKLRAALELVFASAADFVPFELGRGTLVGVETAGGVISTGAVSINDVGTMRMPFRGWFLLRSGEDMEMHAAVPDHTLWPQPGELPQGVDRQLEKAVSVLTEEIADNHRDDAEVRYATQRDASGR